MVNTLKDFKKIINEMIMNQIISLKGIDLFTVTDVNLTELTVNIKRMNFNESYDEVKLLGVGLGNAKGQIKLPNIDDVVLVIFVGNSQEPIVIGSLFDVYSTEKDSKLDVRLNEYFINNQTNGAYFFMDENNNIIFKTPNGAKLKLNEDGSFKLFNKDNYGFEVSDTGAITIRGVTIEHTQTPGTWQ